MRRTSLTYQDPLDVVWLHLAASIGMQIQRSGDVYASWNGKGVLAIGNPQSLDSDDCMAQMILHEVCHALVEGPESIHRADWGLQIDDPKQRVREHACLRLQAALTSEHGLRQFLAATTVFRKYYDVIPEDPLQADGDPATEIALKAWPNARHGPWSESLQLALRQTAQIAATIRPVAPPDSLWSAFSTGS